MENPEDSLERIDFLGTPFDIISQDSVLRILRNGNFAQSPFSYLVTPNADHVVRNADDHNLRAVYNDAFLSVCDSKIVSKLALRKGFPLHEVITGSGLTEKLFEDVLSEEHKICIIGCDSLSVQHLRDKYNLTNVAHYNPPMGFINSLSEVQLCCDFVRSNLSDFVLLAVGSPQQEKLAKYIQEQKDCKGLGLCIGASLLFLTGVEKRSPKVLSTLGLEWLFRLSQNPKRLWKRYYHDLKIFPMAYNEKPYDNSPLIRKFTYLKKSGQTYIP